MSTPTVISSNFPYLIGCRSQRPAFKQRKRFPLALLIAVIWVDKIEGGVLVAIIIYDVILIECNRYPITFNGEEPIEVRIPQHMSMKIAQTDPGEKGNTAQGGTKPAILVRTLILRSIL